MLDAAAREMSGNAPNQLSADNCSEFTGHMVDLWAYHHKVRIEFSRPGKSTDNGFIEAFNSKLRAERLNGHWFLVHRHFRIADGKVDLAVFQEPSKADLAASLDSFIAILNKSNEIVHAYFNSSEDVKQRMVDYVRLREEKGLSWLDGP